MNVYSAAGFIPSLSTPIARSSIDSECASPALVYVPYMSRSPLMSSSIDMQSPSPTVYASSPDSS